MIHFYNIYGIKFRIRTNNQIISTWLKRTLDLFEVGNLKKDIDVKLDFIYLRNKAFKFRLPKGALLVDSFNLNLNGQDIKGFTYCKDNGVFLIQSKLMYNHWDERGGSCFIFSHSFINSIELYYLIKTLILDIIARRGYFPIHSSGIIIDKKCVIFVGDSGSGKSTIATYLIKRGFGFLGDDVVLLKKKSGLWLYPFSSYIALNKRKSFDYFKKNIHQIKKDNYWFKEKRKFFLNMKKINPNLFIEKAPLVLIIFPVLSTYDESRIKRVSSEEAFRRIFRQIGSSICENKERAVLSGFLAKNVNCFKLYLGKNLRGLENIIRAML